MAALITSFHGPAEILRPVTLPKMRAYADRHGYEIIEAPAVEDCHVVWWSVLGVLRALQAGHDRVVWMDADILVLDDRHDVAGTGDAFAAFDGRLAGLCACLWGVRNRPDRVQQIQAIWDSRHADWGSEREQAAIKAMLTKPVLLGEPWIDRYGLLVDGVRFGHGQTNCGTWEQRRDYLARRPVKREHITSLGHEPAAPPPGPYDCSGAVSALLIEAGLLDRPLWSGELMNWGEPGIGEIITVWTNEAHCFAEIGDANGVMHFGAYENTGPQDWVHPHDGFVCRRPELKGRELERQLVKAQAAQARRARFGLRTRVRAR